MQYCSFMRGSEPRANLPRNLNCFVRRQATDATQQRREFFAFDVLHRQEMMAINFPDVVNTAHVLVRDLSGDAHFAMKPRQRRTIRDFGWKKLERNGLTQFQIIRAIHFTHPAFAKESNDTITVSQNRSRNETRVVDRIERRR
jgi:hypothetical protein